MRTRKTLWVAIVLALSIALAGCTIEDIHSWFPGGIVIPPPPGKDDPPVEDPGTEDPGSEDPGSEDPGSEDPGTEDPGTEDPPGEEPPVEDPPVDDPPIEDPPAEDPPVDDPPVDDPVDVTIEMGWIREDSTRFRTPYYVIEAPIPGPTLMVVGGMHGNELGYLTAQRIVDELRPDRGRVVVIPRANAPAVEANTRGVSDLPDLNRRFPLGKSPVGRTANDIWELVLEYEPDWFIDLHEGYDYYIRNKNSVGQTVIYYPTGRAQSDATALVNYLNGMPAVTLGRTERFTLLRNPVADSLARKVGQDLGIPAAIIETCWKDPVERRVGFHTYAVKFIASRIGMTLE